MVLQYGCVALLSRQMNSKIAKRIAIGVALYAIFVATVISYYPDSTDNMDYKDRQEFNKLHIAKLEIGASRNMILELLGSPDISEAKKDGDTNLQVMFYRTQHKKADGITTLDECTPLLFENDILVAWGEGTYQSYNDS